MVGIECDEATFQEGPYQKLFYQNSASKVANWIIVDILMYLYNLANS